VKYGGKGRCALECCAGRTAVKIQLKLKQMENTLLINEELFDIWHAASYDY
jgi:hypothetical protein